MKKVKESYWSAKKRKVKMSSLKTALSKLKLPYLAEDTIPTPKVLKTGVFCLNIALKNGGLPKMTIISGLETTFKSSLCKIIVANAQKQDKSVMWVDADNDWDDRVAQNVGINLSEIFLVEGGTVENIIDIIEETRQQFQINVLVIDSIARLASKYEEKSHTQCLNMLLRFLVGLEDTTIILTNQLRDKIGASSHAYPYAKPGGVIQDLVGQVELRMVKGSPQFDEDNRENGAISHEIRFIVIDSLTGKEGNEGTFRLWLENYDGHKEGEVDEEQTILAYAERYGLDVDADRTQLREVLEGELIK